MGSVPGQAELLSENAHTRVVRLHLPEGRSVVRKEPLGPDAEERARHEAEILRRLSGVANIVHLAPDQPDARVIMLEDIRGVPLARVSTPLEPARMVGLMLDLACVVAAMHQQGVVHCDISPPNIVLGEDGPYLIDFALATTFAELRPEFTHPQEIVGTLPYLAPEQTGRTGRSMDRRADLYGLGATMYELATGRPPFGTGDPLRLIHDHLARAATPPGEVNPALPPGLSEIIMHLLEKEPDNRYQSAEGLRHDLERVRDGAQQLRVGENDAPLRLTEPSRLVGRDNEIAVLRAAFDGVLSGECRTVVIVGESGVGKSALIDELRPMVAGVDGWFTSGRFDRYRHDQEHDGVGQALRGLGRLLLAEPEDELAEIRQRLLQVLGPNAGLAAVVLPEFATLLKVAPDPGDPLTAQVRARRTAVEILRAVASRTRPVVFVVDDVQWGEATPLGFLGQLLSGEEEVPSLLAVVAYREGEVTEGHPLASMVQRWGEHPGRPELLRLANLDEGNLAALLGEMLRAPGEVAADLAASIIGVTGGNPYETVQLLNGLRREGVLQPTESGWRWDPPMLQRHLGRENVTELTAARVGGMPPETRDALQIMACLGGEVRVSALAVATDLSEATVAQRLAPALDDGMLLMVARGEGARFHHDRLRDAVLTGTAPQQLRELRLRLARRLAVQPELFASAADQYLPVVDDLRDLQERQRAATLLHRAADQRMWIGESLPAERMLAAALRLTDDPATLLQLHTARHAALFRLGRLAEADEIYEKIVDLSTGPYDRVEATRAQISSLTNRNRSDDAISLGLGLLQELGWAVPGPDQVNIEIDRELDWCARWIDETSEADDLGRPNVTDPMLFSAGALINRMLPACFFRDQVTMGWLALSAARIWAEKGPTQTLTGAVGHLPWVLIGRRQAYRTGHRLLRRLLVVAEDREFEPYTSQLHFLYALGVSHWFEPLEEEESHGRRAREGLVRGGDPQAAAYAFCAPLYEIDLASTVDDYAAEVEAALSFTERTGNQHAAGLFRPYRWLVAALRGEPASADGARMLDNLGGEPVAMVNGHTARALAAAMLDDPASLAEHSAAAMSRLSAVEATYVVWQAHLVRAIAIADRVRAAPDRAVELAELDDIVDWIAQRAADMPRNFRHMLSLVQAERAWAVGDFRAAMHAFDSALRDAGHRPWHRAYIAERSAKFMLAHGLDYSGWARLVEAREAYRTWGARAKVDQLDRAYPSREAPADAAPGVTRRASITAGAIDMFGILDASRTLSSETSVGALRAKVIEVLSAMTGATHVNLLVWNGEQRRWLVATGDADELARLDEQHQAPDSVIRYVERTREPLIVGDATRDDRFARDPYFHDLEPCSLLAVPVLSRGALRAILLLENRLIRDAFPTDRLEVVMLIAGQLAVSLDNALIYSSMERQVAERTEQLARANEQLEQLSITDPLTGLANRRRFEDVLLHEAQRVQRILAPLSLAMVDIDHFKQYNDRHGHREGDRCLQRVAAQLDRNIRDTDLVARYGGEEFAIVMPHTDSGPATEAAERMRLAISALAEPLTADQVVTVSIGVATLHDPDGQNTDQLVERADAALYDAKRSGRNRVCTANTR
jgi:diguanylate cyclase (GGDEF)-like protein